MGYFSKKERFFLTVVVILAYLIGVEFMPVQQIVHHIKSAQDTTVEAESDSNATDNLYNSDNKEYSYSNFYR